MAQIERTFLVDAPVEKVFTYCTNPSNLPEIWPSLLEVKDVQLPAHVGSSYRWVYKLAGMRFEGTTEVIEYVANQRIALKDTGGIEAVRAYTFESKDGATNMSFSLRYTVPVPLLGRLVEALVVKLNENEADVFIANLKARMET
jgi:uncharacterized membrane protein